MSFNAVCKKWHRIGLAAVSVVACAAPAPSHPPAPSPHATADASGQTGWSTGVRAVVSERLGLKLLLPGRGWVAVDPGQGWVSARHDLTHSLLRLRTWEEGKLVNAADCQHALERQEPSLASALAVDLLRHDEGLNIAGFRSRLLVAVSQAREAEPFGLVVAVGGRLRRCWAAVFTTTAADPRAVVDRVEWIADRVIPRVQERTIEQRVKRE